MTSKRLDATARTALILHTLYAAADALCNVFVPVYLWLNSRDFNVVGVHYLVQYATLPFFFILGGWCAQRYDRTVVYRAGLVLHVVYYACFLILRERAADHVVELGALLGVTWGIYYIGANTFNFDVTVSGAREFYAGVLNVFTGTARLLSPMIGGAIIVLAPDKLVGYHVVFALALALYAAGFLVSFRMPRDVERRPFHLRQAIFPGKDQRDWRLMLCASFTFAGIYDIFLFLLGLMMYMLVESEMILGAFGSAQALAGILTALTLSRLIVPKSRKRWLFWSVAAVVLCGALLSLKLTLVTLFVFGVLRAAFSSAIIICDFSITLDVISEALRQPWQRIDYLTAWELPLALGRVVSVAIIIALYNAFDGDVRGLQLGVLYLCCLRIFTYYFVSKTSVLTRHDGA